MATIEVPGPYKESAAMNKTNILDSQLPASSCEPNCDEDRSGNQEPTSAKGAARRGRSASKTSTSGRKSAPKKKPAVCGICKEEFTCKERLAKHRRTKGCEIAYRCDQCGSVFSRIFTLNMHKRTHSTETRFKCTSCNEVFTEREQLTVHEQTHIKEKHDCELCGKSFAYSTTRDIHMKAHELDIVKKPDGALSLKAKAKPLPPSVYACDVCGKLYTRLAHLEKHVEIYYGKTPYRCCQCNEQFDTKTSLSEHHARGHSSAKHLKCGLCEEIIEDYDDIEDHIQGHYVPKEDEGMRTGAFFRCEKCGKWFTFYNELLCHMESHMDSTQCHFV